MTSVQQHLIRCAEDYEARAANPVVAWDCMGASAWGSACRRFASETAAMSDTEAVAWLTAKRDAVPAKAGDAVLPGWYLQMDWLAQMDRILDPVARERVGWIEVGSNGGLDGGRPGERPGYRRMLGVNRCVSYCGRERGEDDSAWLRRRADWLSRYHGGIWVARSFYGRYTSDGNHYTQIVGTVGSFASQTHLVERESDRRDAA